MLKFGLISSVDAVKGLAKVHFAEDDHVSAWLKMAVVRSGKDKFSFPFDLNEHVYCLMDDNMEYGVICGAIYDQGNMPHADAGEGIISLHFGDGSAILYNRNSSVLTLDIKGEVNIECEEANIVSTGEIKITAPTTKVIGVLEVTGAATITGVVSMGGMSGISGAPIAGSDAELNVASITATEDVTAAGTSLKLHTHTSSTAGTPTGPPI